MDICHKGSANAFASQFVADSLHVRYVLKSGDGYPDDFRSGVMHSYALVYSCILIVCMSVAHGLDDNMMSGTDKNVTDFCSQSFDFLFHAIRDFPVWFHIQAFWPLSLTGTWSFLSVW